MFDIQAWAKEFFQKANTPMDKETSELFLQMVMIENVNTFTTPNEIKQQFLYQVIDKRAEFIGLELSEPAKTFLMFLTKSPGTAVMYLYALRSKFNSVNISNIAETFPVGFLSESSLEEMWDKQKGFVNQENVDNCLDRNFEFN